MITENTREKLKQVLKDIKEDCNEEFTGEYRLRFNDGGLCGVERKEKREYREGA